MIEEIYELSQSYLTMRHEAYQRYFIKNTAIKHRFGIILGERGVGKTTTLIQSLLTSANNNQHSEEILYVQVDHFSVQRFTLYEIAESFYKLGGKFIAFDEIHKYPKWSMELKSIYDTFPNLRILASGSSALEIRKGSHDLSRRALVYYMAGLSLREYIELKCNIQFPSYKLVDLVENHSKYSAKIVAALEHKNIKILKIFKEYLEMGYYPYFREFEVINEFKLAVEQNIHTTLESDLIAIYPQLTGNSIKKIAQLISYLSEAVPFTPDWKKVKSIIGIADDRTVKTYFKYLEDANIITSILSSTRKLKRLEMPEKIYLANTNQLYALTSSAPNIGTLREIFFLSMIRQQNQVSLANQCDFLVNEQMYFEVGGKNKDAKQIKNYIKSYLALDEIEHGVHKRIPLWLFGFLY